MSVTELKDANNLTSNALSIGQFLYIPKNAPVSQDTYIVKSGDTLYGIASKYNLSVDELKKINNLTSNTLSIGQQLKIKSTNEPTSNVYVVSKGDTLYGIASKFGVSVTELKNANNLTTNTLSIGQTLKIPTANTSPNITYIVQKGDSLYSIARKYNTSVDKIKSLNNLNSNLLSIGQTLKIPQ